MMKGKIGHATRAGLLVVLLTAIGLYTALGQIPDSAARSASPAADALRVPSTQEDDTSIPVTDTVIHLDESSGGSQLDAPIAATADDSIQYAISSSRIRLYGNAVVKYKNIEFQAGFIEFDMQSSVLYATGLDSAGKKVQEPIYIEGSDRYTMESMTYNFKTKQARILGVMTQVSEGYLHGEVVKKLANDEVNVANGKFTTCDLKHPHFYIALTKAKVIPHDKIVTGPAWLVIGDVPTPVFLPFGFFPNTSKRSSGILLPQYGEENERGFFLRNGGFYFGISDYVDLSIRGGYYSKGSWDVRTHLNYAWRYHFTGSLDVTYSHVKIGHEGTPSAVNSSSYMIYWNHSQDRRTMPNSTFQANVTFGSSGHNRYNSQTTQEYLNNQISSSIAFTHQFPGTPINISLSISHSQSSRDSIVNLRLPQFALAMTRIYPFKRKNGVGKQRWYEKIGLSYNTNLQNALTIKEQDLFTRKALRQMRNGIQHQASASTSFNLFTFINISPAVNYSENWYLQSYRYHWDATGDRPVRDTVLGFARAWQFNTALSASTKLYGMFTFRAKSYVKAIRHVLTPSVTISYHPDFSLPFFKMYGEVQQDPSGKMLKYSYFDGTLFGGPGTGKSGTVSLALNNNLEMKVRSKEDTATVDKKVSLLDALSLGISYNFLADSLNWSPLSINARTHLFDLFELSAQLRFNPYDCTAQGQLINQYYFQRTHRPLRFESFYFSASFSISKTLTGRGKTQAPPQPLGYLPGFLPYGQALSTDFLMIDYGDFSAPWSLSCSYSYSFSRLGERVQAVQSASLYGSLVLGENWRFGFSTGYDFNSRQFTMSSLNISRSLHCWEMSVNIVPFGTLRSYAFRIGVKAGMLQDLKYDKNRSYLDNYSY